MDQGASVASTQVSPSQHASSSHPAADARRKGMTASSLQRLGGLKGLGCLALPVVVTAFVLQRLVGGRKEAARQQLLQQQQQHAGREQQQQMDGKGQVTEAGPALQQQGPITHEARFAELLRRIGMRIVQDSSGQSVFEDTEGEEAAQLRGPSILRGPLLAQGVLPRLVHDPAKAFLRRASELERLDDDLGLGDVDDDDDLGLYCDGDEARFGGEQLGDEGFGEDGDGDDDALGDLAAMMAAPDAGGAAIDGDELEGGDLLDDEGFDEDEDPEEGEEDDEL